MTNENRNSIIRLTIEVMGIFAKTKRKQTYSGDTSVVDDLFNGRPVRGRREQRYDVLFKVWYESNDHTFSDYVECKGNTQNEIDRVCLIF